MNKTKQPPLNLNVLPSIFDKIWFLFKAYPCALTKTTQVSSCSDLYRHFQADDNMDMIAFRPLDLSNQQLAVSTSTQHSHRPAVVVVVEDNIWGPCTCQQEHKTTIDTDTHDAFALTLAVTTFCAAQSKIVKKVHCSWLRFHHSHFCIQY